MCLKKVADLLNRSFYVQIVTLNLYGSYIPYVVKIRQILHFNFLTEKCRKNAQRLFCLKNRQNVPIY